MSWFAHAVAGHWPARRLAEGVWCFALLVLATGCDRGPVRIPPGDTAFDSGILPPIGPAHEAGRRIDADVSDPCHPLALLARIPTEVPGWVAEPEPIYPHEAIGGHVIGGVGRLYRSSTGSCALVGVGRPRDGAAVAKALAEGGLIPGRRNEVPTLSRPAPEANQVTTWAFPPGGTVLWVRAFGTTDQATLEPFLQALFPAETQGGVADAAGKLGSGDPSGVECPPTAPFPDPYDPGAFYSPPGDCFRPPVPR